MKARVRSACLVVLACLVAMVTSPWDAKPDQSGELAPRASAAGGAPRQAAGKVIETMDAGRYTYIQVDYGDEKIWAAAPHFEVEVGDNVVVPDGAAMADYHSKTLDRTFELVYFVAFIAVMGEDGKAAIPKGHGDAPEEVPEAAIELPGIERAEGGKTVGEIFDERTSLAGQEVTVRGRVVKYTPGVMGKNWIHLQDGTTGVGGANDVTVTSEEVAEVGNTILVRGVVAIDQDFGFGYEYDLLIEDAAITVE